MSGYVWILAAWVLAAFVFAPLFGRYLDRISRHYPRPSRRQMSADVRKALDAHYRRSGRPGMAQGRALIHG